MNERVLKEYREILINTKIVLNDCYFILETAETYILPQPGQFYLLKPLEESSFILHIPVSIYNLNNSQLQFMIKIIGPGTKRLSEMSKGDRIKLLGPLGNGFPLVEDKKVLLISGGIGYAPLFLLKEELIKQNNLVTWLHGGKAASDILPADLTCTESGEIGEKGLVTDLLAKLLETGKYSEDNSDAPEVSQKPFDLIYCCGPQGMMREVSRIVSGYDIPLYVSLEEYMACGMGVCLGCVVKVKDNSDNGKYKTACQDGPVFSAAEVLWDE